MIFYRFLIRSICCGNAKQVKFTLHIYQFILKDFL